MYMVFQCKECGKEFILITEQYIQNLYYIQNIYEDKCITCTYCGSDNVNVEGKYDNLNECINDKHTYRRINGTIKQVR